MMHRKRKFDEFYDYDDQIGIDRYSTRDNLLLEPEQIQNYFHFYKIHNNFPEEKKPKYCRKHYKSGMQPTERKKKCYLDHCSSLGLFYFPQDTQNYYCRKHSKSGMITVPSLKCQETECSKFPSFNYKGEISAIYCQKHANPAW